MSRSGMLRSVLTCAVILASGLFAVPAGAETTTSYNSWAMREDAAPPGTDAMYTWEGPSTGLQLTAGIWNSVGVLAGGPSQEQWLDVTFVPPRGQRLRAGESYVADAVSESTWWSEDPTTPPAMLVWHDGLACGRTEAQLFEGYKPPNPTTGWFHISEIEYNDLGKLTRLAATFEMNCEYVGGPAGVEGSIAVNATTPPAPIPEAPTTPSPVTSLKATNVGPDGGGTNTTTLTWQNPTEFDDITIDMVQSSNWAKLPAVLGSYFTKQYRGRASSYFDGHVEFVDTRTYRVVPRGPSGRLGPPSLLTVMGNLLDIPDTSEKIMIGQEVSFSGPLSESYDYVRLADAMKGPGLGGRDVLLCRQSSIDYVDGACTVVDRTTTTADGHFSLSASPTANQLYNVVVPATGQMLGNTSRVINALVAPRTDLRAPDAQRVSAGVWVRRGSLIRFSTVRARRGSRGIVRLQRYDGHKWRTVATNSLYGSDTRRLTIAYREYARGKHAYRVVKLADSRHVNGRSRTVYIAVR